MKICFVGSLAVLYYYAERLDKVFPAEKGLQNWLFDFQGNQGSCRDLLQDLIVGKIKGVSFSNVDDLVGKEETQADESKRDECNDTSLVSSKEKAFPLNPAALRIGKNAGEIAFATLEATRLLVARDIADGCVPGWITLAIDKNSISSYLGKPFYGHTTYLGEKFLGNAEKVSMAFSTPLFRLLLMTVHIPLAKVSLAITDAKVEQAIEHALLLQKYYNDKQPLLVLGVNPHAGEGGLLGNEEVVVAGVLERWRKRGHAIEGPLAADGAFRDIVRSVPPLKADATVAKNLRTVVSVYHDQGLVAAKIAAKDYNGVNISLGLPFVRTSVDHGTAYAIAGQGKAVLTSLLHASIEAYRQLQSFVSFENKISSVRD